MLYPGAKYRPVSGESRDPHIIPVGVILHVAGGNADSLFAYFNGPSGGIESHLHIPFTAKTPVEQYRRTDQEADANYKGNSWIGSDGKRYGFLSVETAGTGEGEWNDHQLTEILKFIRWVKATYPHIPLVRCPTYRSPGLGYHVMFGSGEGTNSWSNARGKVCPGARRIAQFNDYILPTLANSKTSPLPEPPEVHPVTGVRRVDIEWTASGNGYVVLFEDGGIANYGDAPAAHEISVAGARSYPEHKAVACALHPNGVGIAVLWEKGHIDTRHAPHFGEPLLK